MMMITDHEIPVKRPAILLLVSINKKKLDLLRILPSGTRKESTRVDNHLYLARELKKVKMRAIIFVVSALGMVSKDFEKRLEEYVNQRKNRDPLDHCALLRSDRILREVLETRGDLLSLRLQ